MRVSNCGLGSGDAPAHIHENRRRICAALEAETLLTPRQTHSNIARYAAAAGEDITADALATDRARLALGIVSADCAPILLADRAKPIIAAAHAGWRGALSGISDAAVALMRRLGAEDIVAAIGPHISAPAYQVGEDMRRAALAQDEASAAFFAPDPPDHFRFDLAGYLTRRLQRCGVEVEALALCTFSAPERFFSYRRQGADYGRQISAIMLSGDDIDI